MWGAEASGVFLLLLLFFLFFLFFSFSFYFIFFSILSPLTCLSSFSRPSFIPLFVLSFLYLSCLRWRWRWHWTRGLLIIISAWSFFGEGEEDGVYGTLAGSGRGGAFAPDMT